VLLFPLASAPARAAPIAARRFILSTIMAIASCVVNGHLRRCVSCAPSQSVLRTLAERLGATLQLRSCTSCLLPRSKISARALCSSHVQGAFCAVTVHHRRKKTGAAGRRQELGCLQRRPD
jgi:hypothetical protein